MKLASLTLAAALAVSGGALLPVAPAQAADDLIYTGVFSNTAVGGYDTVAYHTVGEPVRGSRDFSTQWSGAEWRFSSQENLDLFLADPAGYAPQYGGYCAWAMAEGYTAKGDPEFWRIVDGKLYLNFNQEIQDRWETDIPGFITAADANYPAILNN
jgi:YHS domain-containing protein